jgi:hypothetical protein
MSMPLPEVMPSVKSHIKSILSEKRGQVPGYALENQGSYSWSSFRYGIFISWVFLEKYAKPGISQEQSEIP